MDHLEVCGAEAIQALIEGVEAGALEESHPTYPVALPGCSHYLGIPYTPARSLIDAGLPLVLANPPPFSAFLFTCDAFVSS